MIKLAKQVYHSPVKKTKTTKEKLVGYFIGASIVTYASILFGACWTRGCNLMEWIQTFKRFVLSEHHFIVGFTAMTPKLIFVALVVYSLIYIYSATRYEHPFAGEEYGDAKWGDAKAFTEKYGNHDASNEVVVNFGDLPGPKVPYRVNTHEYWIADGVKINIDNELTSSLNMLVVGPQGTGNSFRVARPVLAQLAGCYVVTDPKGELYRQTGQYMEDNGYEVMVLNIESEEAMANSIRFNPFRYIRSEADVMSLAEILFKATTDPTAQADPFFEPSAEVLLTSILYLMHFTYRDEDKNWIKFVELLDSTAVYADETGRIENREGGILDRFTKANENWKNGMYTGGVPQNTNLKGFVEVEKFYNGAHETTSGIVSSLDVHCRYMRLACVQELLSADEIDISNSFIYCKKRQYSSSGKSILYIVTSETRRYFDWITSMVYSLFFDEIYHVTAHDPELRETLVEHLTFLMDEFSKLTLPDSFVDRLSTMRSRGMSAIIILQSLVQLKKKFPKYDIDKELISNMAIVDILGAPAWEDCEYLSKLFGTMTIRKKTTGKSDGATKSHSENEDVMKKPLFSPESIQKMDKNGPCAIYMKGTDPLWVNKVQLQNSPLCPLLTRKDHPYVPQRRLRTVSANGGRVPKLHVGKDAENFLAECRKKDVHVIHLTENDIDAINVLDRHTSCLPGKNPETKTYWDTLAQRAREVMLQEEADRINYAEYTVSQVKVLQKLANTGYSAAQIKELDPLILQNITIEELTEYFNPDMSIAKIQEFVPFMKRILNGE